MRLQRLPGANARCAQQLLAHRCGQCPCMVPAPRLTLGSRNRIGLSCAWQSVKCSSDTAPVPERRRHVVQRVAARALHRHRPSGPAPCQPLRPPPAPARTHACSGSRACLKRQPARARPSASLIDRRLRVEQQRHQVAQLVFVEQAHVAEARHVGARRVGLAVPQLAPGVLNDRRRCRRRPRLSRRAACRSSTGSDRWCRTRSPSCRSDGSCSSWPPLSLVAADASVHVMPRPFCASFSPSRQSPR